MVEPGALGGNVAPSARDAADRGTTGREEAGQRGRAYQAVLGYPAELIPLDNPYVLRPGDMFRVRAVVDGEPVPNQFVIAGGQGARTSTRTDSAGVARVRIGSRGAWYVKFIHMQRVTDDPMIDYESKWATLTFGVQ